MKDVRLLERPLALAVLIAFGLWILIHILEQVLWVLVLVLLAMILAAALLPIVKRMRSVEFPGRRRMPAALAVVLIYLVGLSGLAVVGYLVGGVILTELLHLLASLPTLGNQLSDRLTQLQQALHVPPELMPAPQDINNEIKALASRISGAAALAGVFVQTLASAIFESVFVLTLALFFVVESKDILEFWVHLFPPSQRAKAREVSADIGVKMGQWLLGQLANITIIGALAGIGSALLGLPYPGLFAVVTALLDLSPMLGPTVVAFPAAAIGLTISPLTGLGALLLYFALAAFEAHVLAPLVTGRVVRLSPSLIIIAIPLGIALYGGIGAIIAVPVTAALQVIFSEVVRPWMREQQGLPAAGTNPATAKRELSGHNGKRPYDASDVQHAMDSVGSWAKSWDDVLRFLRGPGPYDSDFAPGELPALIHDLEELKRRGAPFTTDYRQVWHALTGEATNDMAPPEISSVPVSLPELQDRYLRGLEFPATREEAVHGAQENGAPRDVLQVLEAIQDKQYRDMGMLVEATDQAMRDQATRTEPSRDGD